MKILFASINRFRDDPRSAPKTQYVLGTASGGGDGMDFAAGTDGFQWGSESVPYGLKPRRIISLWIDASGLSATHNVIITTGTQKIVVPAGTQTYAIATLNAPFTMTITTDGGTGQVAITAYDYNVLYTGLPGAVVGSAGTTSTTGATSGGSGGYTGGGSGGGGGKGLL